MVNFKLPDRKYIPEIDEISITPLKIRLLIEELENYNKDCRLWKKYDATETEIPEKYRGRNRYWVVVGEGQDAQYGAYTIVSIYDLDPEAIDGRIVIAKYRIAKEDGRPLQTLSQIEKHVKAARLDAERQERQAKSDPRLTQEIKVHMPVMWTPERGRRELDKSL